MHYRLEADYTLPLLEVPGTHAERMRERLEFLYGAAAAGAYGELERILKVHYAHAPIEIRAAERNFDPCSRFSERDVVLITYGDLIVSDDRNPLQTLADVAIEFFRGVVTTLHILPFFPYSSDRGFSVLSFEEVDPKLGSWDEIVELESSFKLMFDGVFNHVSSRSYWFQQYLAGDPELRDFFIGFDSLDAVDPAMLRQVLRPRTTPLLHPFPAIDGTRWVWTTFSADQVDLNFANPKVLLKIIEIMLYYVRRGADLIRLDAVTYLWDQLGTSCAHLGQTHQVVKLLRDVLDTVAPHVALVSETNVPQEDNVSYFGDGTDEAQMVYNFALPPLVLHAIQRGDASILSDWARAFRPPSDCTAFFNLLDSHDGIGVMGAQGILPDDEIQRMCEAVREHGGFVSYRSDGAGGEAPYELNITWFSALNRPDSGEPLQLQVDRFIASRSVALALRGVPGIYLPSLGGHRNDVEAVFREGSLRSINRSVIDEARLLAAIADRRSPAARISERFLDLLEARVAEPAFHPAAEQTVLDLDRRVFALLRSPAEGPPVLTIVNLSRDSVHLDVGLQRIRMTGGELAELISRQSIAAPSGQLAIELAPYQVLWLRARAEAGGPT